MTANNNDSDLTTQISLSIHSVSTKLARLGDVLGRQIGVTAPQWLILAVIDRYNGGRGTAVKDVASKLGVDSSFVSSQIKLLEALHLIERSQSARDGRVVIVSLSELGRRRIGMANRFRDKISKFVTDDRDEDAISALSNILVILEKKLGKALVIAQVDDGL